jgi:CRISPR-associated endonuclease/helicase Cas3
MRSFDDLFRAATGGRNPDGHLARLAHDGFPDVIEANADRTGVILAWLWRRLSESYRATAPRRLVYVLPQRALVEPLAAEVRRRLARLALTDQVSLHAAGVARDQSHGEWRQDMHQPAIVIGTADVLVSKLLLRGYDTGTVMAPIDFALLTNGAHWFVDETRPCPQASATLRRVVALAGQRGTAEPLRLTFIRHHHPERTLVLPSTPAISAAARERHEDGTLTIVVLNTVEAAQAVYRDLRGGRVRCTLLHSRFRGCDRTRILAQIIAGRRDRILVTTRTAEASLGLSAATVIGESSPGAAPDAGAGAGAAAGRQVRVLSESDFLGLFDTGVEADVSSFVQDEEDLDAEVAWATWTPGEEGEPDPEVRATFPEYRCRVPLSLVPRLAADRAVWRFDGDRYVKITDAGQRPVRPGQVLLVSAGDGGYDPERGFDPDSRALVTGCPRLLTPAEQAELGAPESVRERRWQSLEEHSERTRDQAAALVKVLDPDISPDAARSVVAAGFLHDVGKAHPIWQDALCAMAADEDRTMVEAGRPWAKSGGKEARLEFAGGVSFRHELGSLLLIDGPLRHLLHAVPDENLARYGVLAHHGVLRVQVRDPDPGPDRDRDHDHDQADSPQRAIRGLVQGARTEIPPILGESATVLTVDLAQFGPDADSADGPDGDSDGADGGAWTAAVRDLLARYGPFKLAYLETLIRIADWRASAGAELPR